MCAAPLAALARAQEEQNNVEWIPKLNAHAQNVCSALLLPSQNLKSVLVSIRHGFAPLETSRGRQEDQHTQFARRMETKVVVATTWLSVGIGLSFLSSVECQDMFQIVIAWITVQCFR